MLFPRPTGRRLVPAIVFALILAACSPSVGGEAGGDLTVQVTTPTDGAEVSLPFEVTVESNVPIGPPESGNHHVHLYYDTDKSSADYDLVYANSFQVTRELSPGPHTVIASLRNPDHSDAGPEQTFEITVGEGGSGGSGGGGAAEESSPPPLPGY